MVHPQLDDGDGDVCVERLEKATAKLAGRDEALFLRKEYERAAQSILDAETHWGAGLSRLDYHEPAQRFMTRGEQDMVLCISDSHIGKFVDSRTLIPGLNYSHQAFQTYVSELEEQVAQTSLMLAQTSGLRDLYVIQMGDIIEGSSMRLGQRVRIDLTIGEQKYVAAQTLTALYQRLRRLGFRRVIVLSVIGNHGRIGKRLDDDLTVDNHEMGVYHTQQLALYHDPDFVVVPSEAEFSYFKIGQHTFFAQHGHRVTGSGGMSPITGIKRYLTQQSLSVTGVFPDYSLLGHFHQPILHDFGNGRKIIVNGCWDGGDDFTCNVLAAAAGSSQWLLVVDPIDGVWFQRELRLGARRREPLQAFVA